MANSPASSDQRAVWAFWLACVLAVVAGLSPFVFGGGSNRLGGAVVPFAVAAVALAACALLYSQGKGVQKDEATAVTLNRKAASLGNAMAMWSKRTRSTRLIE